VIPEIAGAINALKGASDIAKGMLAFKFDTEMSAKVMDLNRIILDVQQQVMAANESYSAATSRIKELEAELAKLNNWEQEQQRYQLHSLVPGTLVYRIKPDMQGTEPPHDICPNCYQKGAKSILQEGRSQGSYFSGTHIYFCPQCKTEFQGGDAW